MKIKKYEIANLKVSSVRHERVYDEQVHNYREKHTIKIDNGTISKYFTYTTEVIGYINYDNLTKDAMWCLYMDYLDGMVNYCENDFINSFGYEGNIKEGKKVYKQLMKYYKRLEELINNDTLNILKKEFEDY